MHSIPGDVINYHY